MSIRVVSKPLPGIVFCFALALLVSCTTAGTGYHLRAGADSFPPDGSIDYQHNSDNDGTLKILTLNMAHGRNQAANQIFLDRDDIERNLKAIAKLLIETGADIIALQEADGPSRWSGNFDHIEFLAKEAGYPWYHRATHAESWLFSFGTAVLSRLPVDESLHHTFKPSPPTLNKGFLLNRIKWPGGEENGAAAVIDIVSVHLDFSRHRVRDEQIAEMTAVLAGRSNPMVILGDFNSEWLAQDSVVRKLAKASGMSVYRHDADDLYTYNARQRLDWILISDELTFVDYRVLPEVVSDHLAVLAEIRFKTAPMADSGD